MPVNSIISGKIFFLENTIVEKLRVGSFEMKNTSKSNTSKYGFYPIPYANPTYPQSSHCPIVSVPWLVEFSHSRSA